MSVRSDATKKKNEKTANMARSNRPHWTLNQDPPEGRTNPSTRGTEPFIHPTSRRIGAEPAS